MISKNNENVDNIKVIYDDINNHNIIFENTYICVDALLKSNDSKHMHDDITIKIPDDIKIFEKLKKVHNIFDTSSDEKIQSIQSF